VFEGLGFRLEASPTLQRLWFLPNFVVNTATPAVRQFLHKHLHSLIDFSQFYVSGLPLLIGWKCLLNFCLHFPWHVRLMNMVFGIVKSLQFWYFKI